MILQPLPSLLWFLIFSVRSFESSKVFDRESVGDGDKLNDCPIVSEETEDFIMSHPPAQNAVLKSVEQVNVQKIVLDDPYTIGHFTNLSGLSASLSLLEPAYKGSCGGDTAPRRSILESAHQHDCVLAINANYFNESTGRCQGNIVSDGVVVRNDNHEKYPTFGLLKNGSAIMGYIAPNRLSELNFDLAVQGMGWLLKNGENIVNKSVAEECGKWPSEAVKTLANYANLTTARAAIGTDKNGNVLIIQVDGKTLAKSRQGLSLRDFSELLKSYGMYNAVNLDGGGSVSLFYKGAVVNYPADVCGEFRCFRRISAFLCLRRPASKSILMLPDFKSIGMIFLMTVFLVLAKHDTTTESSQLFYFLTFWQTCKSKLIR